jgi:DNA-binding LytR/AlgR family response regulator
MSGSVTSQRPARALLADDERLLREQLRTRLAEVWPELEICGEARDGQEAVDLAQALLPDVVFLDIRMPGMTGLEAAAEIVALPAWSGEIVFVTAYDEYAVAAFERGALDYLLKPVEASRLAQTAQRLQTRLEARGHSGSAGAPDEAALDAMLAKLLQIGRGLGRGDATAQPPLR